MLISDSSRLLFIHIPKTGGMSIRGALKKVRDDVEEIHPRHQTLKETLAKRPELADYFVAGFVRNPWDRLISWWAMVHSAPTRHEGHPHHEFLRWPAWQYIAGFDNFEDFIRDLPSGPYGRFRKPQLKYLTAPGRKADFIGRTENMDHDVQELLRLIGAPSSPVPHYNKSPRPASYRDMYSPETAEIVRRLYEVDIEAFGYRF